MKRRRKCLGCKTVFVPDPRNVNRQRYCSAPACRRTSKAASQQRWLRKPDNQDYFCGPHHVARVQAWRKAHPDAAAKRRPCKKTPLQDSLSTQLIDLSMKNGIFTEAALQETLRSQAFVLTGFIAQFTDSTLQEDIAQTLAGLLRLGRDIVGGQSPPRHEKGKPHAC